MNANAGSRADDELEMAEWLASLEAVTTYAGEGRARDLLQALEKRARELGIYPQALPYVGLCGHFYINTR